MIIKKEKIREENKEKRIATFEIFLLVISIAAFAYFVGEEFKVVSATGGDAPDVGLPAATVPTPEETGGKIVENFLDRIYGGGTATPSTAPFPTDVGAIEITEGVAGTGLTPPMLSSSGGAASASFPTSPAGSPSAKVKFFQTALGKGVANILGNAAIAYGLYSVTKWIWSITGWDPELGDQLAKDLSIGYGIGAGVGILGHLLAPNAAIFSGFNVPMLGGLVTVPWLAVIGVTVGLLMWVFTAKQHYTTVVAYTCYPWQPVNGGQDCSKCTSGEFGCTKYKCESLGYGCQLLKTGTNEEACIGMNRNDVAPPKIEAWKDALTEGYIYTPDNARLPPDRGVTIKNTKSADGCLPPFSRVSYGVTLDELGRCKVDIVRTNSFDKMRWSLSLGYPKYNHSIIRVASGVNESEEGTIELEAGGTYETFVRCQDVNDPQNTNAGSFVFKYCVQDEPDTTAPKIALTTPINGMPVQHGLTSQLTEIYVDKPSTCKWSHSDEDYDNMANSMQCAGSISEINANMLFKCTTTLTGLKDETENKFYIRCKSYPELNESDRYKNEESYPYTLIGTKALVIDSVTVNGFSTGEIIKDSTKNVHITLGAVTSAGFKDGEAKCYFKEKTAADNSYILFLSDFSEWNYDHSQDLWPPRGDYKYTIKCCDLGGNCATEEIEFTVDTDFVPPIVVRAYNEGGDLKIVTDENANCVYDTTSCSYTFEDGIGMTSSDNLEHTTSWNTDNNFYIKCKDDFGNQPAPDGCSIIIRPFDTF